MNPLISREAASKVARTIKTSGGANETPPRPMREHATAAKCQIIVCIQVYKTPPLPSYLARPLGRRLFFDRRPRCPDPGEPTTDAVRHDSRDGRYGLLRFPSARLNTLNVRRRVKILGRRFCTGPPVKQYYYSSVLALRTLRSS